MKLVLTIFLITFFQNIFSQFRFQIEGSVVTRRTMIENFGYIPSFYELRKNPVSGLFNFGLGYQFKSAFGINLGINHISTVNKEKFYLDAFDVDYRLFHRSTTISSFEPQIMFNYSFNCFSINDLNVELGVDIPIQKMRSYIWSNNIDYLDQYGETAIMSIVKTTTASKKQFLRPRLNIGKQFKLSGSENHIIYLALTMRKSFDYDEVNYHVMDKGVEYHFKYFLNSSFLGITFRYSYYLKHASKRGL